MNVLRNILISAKNPLEISFGPRQVQGQTAVWHFRAGAKIAQVSYSLATIWKEMVSFIANQDYGEVWSLILPKRISDVWKQRFYQSFECLKADQIKEVSLMMADSQDLEIKHQL